ncbi:hypothetical protein [Lentzea albida]|uniref:Uncharacterized protein n=1 Tax=Lentzea albida TaxID=65499 RepID=A0A1H9W9N8_9PSEU|nr:hypothetical protein [Lentzea albida]SES30640.1 hypothetical protein SAMN04488000_12187 [Lentzea albida]
MTPPRTPKSRRRTTTWIALAVVLACATTAVVAIRQGWFASSSSDANSAAVGRDGVDLTVGGVRIHGPAGIAPEGTTLTAHATTAAAPGLSSTITANIGTGIEISLGGRQPEKPLELEFPVTGTPPEGRHAVLVTTPSDGSGARLVPASFDAGRNTITATADHLSSFWPAFLDLRAAGRVVDEVVGNALGITSARPACAGTPATDPSGMKITMDGDYSASAKPVVWPCVTVQNGRMTVELTSNSPLPWRVRAAPSATLEPQGAIDPAKAAVLGGYHALATKRPYAEGLLIPGSGLKHTFPVSSLPATVEGQVDVGTWLVMDLVFAVQAIMALFHVDLGAVTDDAAALGCLGDAVEAAKLDAKPGADAVAALAKAALTCLEPVAKALGGGLSAVAGFVLLVLSSGVALVFGGLQGALMSLTGTDRFKIALNGTGRPVSAADLRSAPVPGMCRHPAGKLVDGKLPGIPENDGFVSLQSETIQLGDLTGDGTRDAAAIFDCSRGGVGWPNHVVLYGPGPKVLGSIDLGDVITDAEHSVVSRMSIADGDISLTWNSYQGASFCLREWTGRIHWDGSKASLLGLKQVSGAARGTC